MVDIEIRNPHIQAENLLFCGEIEMKNKLFRFQVLPNLTVCLSDNQDNIHVEIRSSKTAKDFVVIKGKGSKWYRQDIVDVFSILKKHIKEKEGINI